MPLALPLGHRRAALALATVLFAGLAGPAAADRGDRRPAHQRLVLFGAATEGSTHSLSGLDRFEEAARKRVSMYAYYQSFHSDAHFDAKGANALHRRDVIPLLTWEPWNPKAGRKAQPPYSLDRIVAGRYDDYIGRWARQIADWGKPLWLRFAHEMNGDWYPWGMGVDGNSPKQYREAWRRIHRIFEKAGARNVIWVWSPNITYRGGSLYHLGGGPAGLRRPGRRPPLRLRFSGCSQFRRRRSARPSSSNADGTQV